MRRRTVRPDADWPMGHPGPRRPISLELVPLVLAALLLQWGRSSPAAAQQPAVPVGPAPAAFAPAAGSGLAGELIVGIYLPGLYFAQLGSKVELGSELAEHLSHALGRPATARVYATAAAMENDAAKITFALVEAPYVASRLNHLTPLCAASPGGKDETRLVVMGDGALGEVANLGSRRLAYAAQPYDEQAFLDNFVFEGEMQLGTDHLEPARDAASALSKIPLKKADAVLLYEDDVGRAKSAGLQKVYETAPLPRPTLIVFEHYIETADIQRLRDIMSRFSGHAHPLFPSFRPAVFDRYINLHAHVEKRGQRLPPLIDLGVPDLPPKIPTLTAGSMAVPPLKLYALPPN